MRETGAKNAEQRIAHCVFGFPQIQTTQAINEISIGEGTLVQYESEQKAFVEPKKSEALCACSTLEGTHKGGLTTPSYDVSISIPETAVGQLQSWVPAPKSQRPRHLLVGQQKKAPRDENLLPSTLKSDM